MKQKAGRPPAPVVGLIGPTNLAKMSNFSGITEQIYEDHAYHTGKLVADHGATIALVPDRGVALAGLNGYRDAGGEWIIGLVPSGGPSDAVATPNCLDNALICNEVLSDFTWHHQHALICELSDLLVCVGLSCGTIAEIAWTKWVKGPKILALANTMTSVPPEILADVDMEFVSSLASLESRLAEILHSNGRLVTARA
ncbi:hypothetical protein [Rhizobium leguminosarum]|uniref:Uncharacterized protein n=1 Tax=Rhizobium leguminosarum TaxID=384 RepID=A0A7K3VQM1_RHILE|nr:hypothetical protein [Rhizobium leguminosarum]NEK19007.1 hypothetical protein [Rhizobium leguminosarum]